MKVRDAILWDLSQAGWNKTRALARVQEIIEKLDLVHLAEHLCGKLSAGEAMRVSLLKAVAKKPFIVLADEPTGQLDTDNIRILIDLMKEVVKEGTSILVATHDIRFQTLSDRTVMILDGKLASEEEAEELLKERIAFLSNRVLDKEIYEVKLIVDSSNLIRVPDNILKRLEINRKLILTHNIKNGFASFRKSDDDSERVENEELSVFQKFSRSNLKANSIVKATSLTKLYKTHGIENLVLNKIQFDIKQGEFLVFLGPSGTGKTTLMNIIAGLEKPTSGQMMVDGKDIHKGSNEDKRKILLHSLSYVTQNYTVHPYLSVEENAILPLLLKGKKKPTNMTKIIALFKSFGMDEYRDLFPTELSGGEQQRSSVIASLVKNTRIFLADEPTANLDSDLALVVMNQLTELAESGRTIILATHDYMLIRPGYRVIRISDGDIIEDVIADQDYVDHLFKLYLV